MICATVATQTMHPKPIACFFYFVISFIFFLVGVLGVLSSVILHLKASSFVPWLLSFLFLSIVVTIWSIFGLCGATYAPSYTHKRLVSLILSLSTSYISVWVIAVLSGIPLFFHRIRDYAFPAIWERFNNSIHQLPPNVIESFHLLTSKQFAIWTLSIFSILLLFHFLFGWRLLGMKRFVKLHLLFSASLTVLIGLGLFIFGILFMKDRLESL